MSRNGDYRSQSVAQNLMNKTIVIKEPLLGAGGRRGDYLPAEQTACVGIHLDTWKARGGLTKPQSDQHDLQLHKLFVLTIRCGKPFIRIFTKSLPDVNLGFSITHMSTLPTRCGNITPRRPLLNLMHEVPRDPFHFMGSNVKFLPPTVKSCSSTEPVDPMNYTI